MKIRRDNLSSDCRGLLSRAGAIIEIDNSGAPHYGVMSDQLRYDKKP
ncbi:MAG: hypothetical protein IPJ71_02060 [Bdellovibrionales bacterium]|nr:hypothetical protein [Bdellovibrionales bacterium]